MYRRRFDLGFNWGQRRSTALTSNRPQQHLQPDKHTQLSNGGLPQFWSCFLRSVYLFSWCGCSCDSGQCKYSGFDLQPTHLASAQVLAGKTYNSHIVWNVSCSFKLASPHTHTTSAACLTVRSLLVCELNCFSSRTCTQLYLCLQLLLHVCNFSAGLLWLFSWIDH